MVQQLREKGIQKLLFIFILSMLIRLLWVINDPPLYYDEAEFILLARSLLNGNGYYLSYGTWQSARPPLLPFVLFCVYRFLEESQILAHITCAVASSLAVFTTYFLAKEMYGDRVAFNSAIFTALNPIHVALASSILTENLFVLLEPLFVLSILRIYKNKWIFVSCILISILFTARYTAPYVALFVFLWMILERRKQLVEVLRSPIFYLSALAAILVLIPWFLIGQHYYGGPLRSAIVYASLQGPYKNITELVIFATASISTLVAFPLFLLPFFILGILIKANPWRNFLLLWIMMSIFLSTISKPLVHITPMVAVTYMLRYNFISFPAFALATGRGVEDALRVDKNRSMKRSLIVILLLANLSVSIYMPYYLRYVRTQDSMVKSYKEASMYVTTNSGKDEYILTNAPAFISYYSHRNCLLIPDSLSNLTSLVKSLRSPFLVISLYEAQTDKPAPSYLSEMMNDKRFKLEYTLNVSEEPVIYIFNVREVGS